MLKNLICKLFHRKYYMNLPLKIKNDEFSTVSYCWKCGRKWEQVLDKIELTKNINQLKGGRV